MFLNLSDYTFYLHPGKTDMRKRSASLSLMVQNEMNLNPFDKSVFMFCARNHNIIKAIIWDSNGFWEYSKKIEKGHICWPENEEEACRVNIQDVKNMISGQNPWRRLDTLYPTKI